MYKYTDKEQFKIDYIDTGANSTETILRQKPHLSRKSAGVEGSLILAQIKENGEFEELKDKLKAQQGTKIDKVAKKYDYLLNNSSRPVIVKDKVELYPDNACQLETAKTLTKIYGGLGQSDTGSYHDNRSINISLNSNDVTKLDDICKRLERMKNRDDFISGEISGEIGAGGGMAKE